MTLEKLCYGKIKRINDNCLDCSVSEKDIKNCKDYIAVIKKDDIYIINQKLTGKEKIFYKGLFYEKM